MKTHDLTKGPCPHCGEKNDTNLFEIDHEAHTVQRVDQTNHRCLAMAEAELAEAVAVLRDVEWNGGPFSDHCPWCREIKANGHDSDCCLAKVIGSQQ